MTPVRANDPDDWTALLALIHRAFAGMDGRIDPPSSLHRLTPDAIARHAVAGEIWVIGSPAIACVCLTPREDHLYFGKLAVDPSAQRRGHARRLIELALVRARALGLPRLQLETRIELVENHATFRALGFSESARTAHPGFDRPTALTFTRPV